MHVLAIGGTDKAQQYAIKYGLAVPAEYMAIAIVYKTQLQPENGLWLPQIACKCRPILGIKNKQWIKITKSSLQQVWPMGQVFQ